MRLTPKQQSVLDELLKIGRENAYRYRGVTPHMHANDRAKLAAGDQHCVLGLGGLTFQVGHRLDIGAGSVLSIFKALQHKGLVICEEGDPNYQRPRYWWPVGLAAELSAELLPASEVTP